MGLAGAGDVGVCIPQPGAVVVVATVVVSPVAVAEQGIVVWRQEEVDPVAVSVTSSEMETLWVSLMKQIDVVSGSQSSGSSGFVSGSIGMLSGPTERGGYQFGGLPSMWTWGQGLLPGGGPGSVTSGLTMRKNPVTLGSISHIQFRYHRYHGMGQGLLLPPSVVSGLVIAPVKGNIVMTGTSEEVVVSPFSVVFAGSSEEMVVPPFSVVSAEEGGLELVATVDSTGSDVVKIDSVADVVESCDETVVFGEMNTELVVEMSVKLEVLEIISLEVTIVESVETVGVVQT